jgi:superfamily II DNA or RNA helicase
VIAAVETPCVVLVHTEDIFNQWVDYAQKALAYKPGYIQGERWDSASFDNWNGADCGPRP